MVCEKCGKEIDKVVTNRFDRDGSDYELFYPLIDVDYRELEEDGKAVYFETDQNWTGYELTEEEQIEIIECPYCGKFPFKHEEVQVYDIVRVVCFKTNECQCRNGSEFNGVSD